MEQDYIVAWLDNAGEFGTVRDGHNSAVTIVLQLDEENAQSVIAELNGMAGVRHCLVPARMSQEVDMHMYSVLWFSDN